MEQLLILGRYRPLEDLGQGTFGSVVVAWDTRMHRRVAIKRLELPLDAAGHPVKAAGLAEARTAAMLNHPNIVTVLDFDTDADEAFLVMEYVDGASLRELLDFAGEGLEGPEVAAVLEDVCGAIAFAHTNGVLHLDLKPANILITRDGRAKVADFGMSELSSLAGHGPAWGGTPGYMPVEQVEGESVTEATDLWALGVLAYELTTGRNPFARRPVQSSLASLAAFVAPPPSRHATWLSREADEIFACALASVPAERYDSVEEFADDLLGVLPGPGEGRSLLAALVEDLNAEEPEDTDPLGALGLWDLLASSSLARVSVRAVAGAQSAWLAYSGLMPLGLAPAARTAVAALAAGAAVFAPGLGVGLGLACLMVGLGFAGAWGAFAALLAAGVPWWWLLARHSTGGALLPLTAPALSVVHLGLAQPLLAGFALPPVPAAATALVGGVLTLAASAASGQAAGGLVVTAAPGLPDVWQVAFSGTAIEAAISPATLVALLGWSLAAATTSVLSARATRAAGMTGVLAGGAVLAAAYALAHRVSVVFGFAQGYGSSTVVISLGASLILMLTVAIAGAPLRAEPDEAPPQRT